MKTVFEEQQVLVFRLLSSLLPALPHHQQDSRVFEEAQMQSRGEIRALWSGLPFPLRRLEAISSTFTRSTPPAGYLASGSDLTGGTLSPILAIPWLKLAEAPKDSLPDCPHLPVDLSSVPGSQAPRFGPKVGSCPKDLDRAAKSGGWDPQERRMGLWSIQD